MRILFMGTPDIAATVLCEAAKYHEICGVFCQPDKPVGRRAVMTAPQTKISAQRLGIPVYQPTKLRDERAARLIREINPDLIAVVAYGRILPKEILEIPKFGCVNIHASLLPKYRGAAPIQYALLNGDEKTGVTAMYMDEGMDTGDIIAVSEVDITDADDAVTMFQRLGQAGAALLCSTLSDIEKGIVTRKKQEDCGVSFAPPFTKESGEFSWSEDAKSIFNRTRALCVWPNAYFRFGGKKIKLLKARYCELEGSCGEILSLDPLIVAAKGGSVELCEVKPEGSRQMSGRDWSLGIRAKINDILMEV
ncbi:MAG: methionyl-tRNA formyltransferase [Oscillospiraceae bacterium]